MLRNRNIHTLVGMEIEIASSEDSLTIYPMIKCTFGALLEISKGLKKLKYSSEETVKITTVCP